MSDAKQPQPVYCVAEGDMNGRIVYSHHDAWVPNADCFTLYAAPPAAAPIEVTDAMIEAAWKAMKVEPTVPMTTAVRERLRASIKAGIEAALREQGR